jgi:predicted  nucleic acid-binding Zn-ribbon protein
MATAALPNGHSLSLLVRGLEDDNHRLEQENSSLREEIARLRAQNSDLRKEATDVEAERDDYKRECSEGKCKTEAMQKTIYEQMKAEFEQKYQVLNLLASNMDLETWFSIIDSRENAYHSRVQNQHVMLQDRDKEIEKLKEVNRQKETEMSVLRSWSMNTFLFAVTQS